LGLTRHQHTPLAVLFGNLERVGIECSRNNAKNVSGNSI